MWPHPIQACACTGRRSRPMKTLWRSGVIVLALWGCSSNKASVKPTPASGSKASGRAAVETVTVRDPDTERRIARLELRVMERDAQLADLQSRLEDARQEV